MPKRTRRVPFGRLVRLTLVLAVPAFGALIVLVGVNALKVGPALLAAAAVVIALGWLLRHALGDLAAVTDYLRAWPDGPDDIPELRFSYAARELALAAKALRRRMTRHIKTVEAAAESQGKVMDNLPDPLLMVNDHGQVVRSNPAARALFARKLEGGSLSAVIRDPSLLDAVEAALEGGSRQALHYSITGTVDRHFQVTVEPLPEMPDGTQVMILLHDITALVRAEQMRADFVANASHEIRTPLSSILGFIETLRGPARDDEEARDKFLGIMHQQAVRMKRLIEDLLSLSRIELNEHTPPTERVDVVEVVQSVTEALQIQAEEKRMPLVIEAPADVAEAIGEADELAQVMQNLLSNAIKYGRAETPVTVRIGWVERGPASMPHATRTHCLAIAVIDQGEGIPKEHLPRLTERFYRVDTARSRELGGTGLGLAIVKHIVNRHRGALTVDSQVGRGSTFTVYLPAASKKERV